MCNRGGGGSSSKVTGAGLAFLTYHEGGLAMPDYFNPCSLLSTFSFSFILKILSHGF